MVVGKGEKGEDRGVGVDGREKEGKEVLVGDRVMEVRAVQVLLHFLLGEAEDLTDVFESIGIATEGEIGERDEESGDVLDREVGSDLCDHYDEPYKEHGRQCTLINETICCQKTSNSLTSSGIPLYFLTSSTGFSLIPLIFGSTSPFDVGVVGESACSTSSVLGRAWRSLSRFAASASCRLISSVDSDSASLAA